jgi:hypothetical protein
MHRSGHKRSGSGCSPEPGLRGGTSPAQTDPGRPGSALDETWSWGTLVTCATPLGGWHEPTAAGTALSAVEADRCGGARRRSALQQQG